MQIMVQTTVNLYRALYLLLIAGRRASGKQVMYCVLTQARQEGASEQVVTSRDERRTYLCCVGQSYFW